MDVQLGGAAAAFSRVAAGVLPSATAAMLDTTTYCLTLDRI